MQLQSLCLRQLEAVPIPVLEAVLSSIATALLNAMLKIVPIAMLEAVLNAIASDVLNAMGSAGSSFNGGAQCAGSSKCDCNA